MRLLPYFLVGTLLVSSLQAYNVDLDSGGYAQAWEPGLIPMRIMVPAPAGSLTDGNTYAGSIQTAMQIWNAQLGVVQFSSQSLAPGSYASGNGLNEIVMDGQYNSGDTRKDFGTNTLAITVTYTQGNTRVESDLVFNTAFTWNSYRGNRIGSQVDIQRVALHELGHTLGLGHPDESGQSVSAIMNSMISNIDNLQPDDIAGAQLFYAAPGFVPPNNDFANATVITLGSSTVQLAGSNIAASKQSGEPSHAGSTAPNGHSVWWRWTAPGSGSTTITTLGSNFDTALAIYTGSLVSALSVVGSNDDVQGGVVRTSTVTFNAVGGTTYSIAVDGFARSSDGDQYTPTGAITLNLSYAGPLGGTAPTFTTQPTSQTVVAGNTVTFTVAASGSPALSYQWQRKPVGSGTWANLSNGGNYSNTTTATVSVSGTTVAMSGDQFRCVATNSVSSATSNVATLTVTVALPTITTQPVSRTVTPGTSVNFSVVASSSVSLTYQWRKDGVALSGATNTSYSIANVQNVAVGSYTVVVTNSGGSTTSAAATLSLGTIPAGFDVSAYLARYPAVAAIYGSDLYGAWIYYRNQGIYNGEVFDELFRVEEYFTLYPELFALFGSDLGGALEHWLSQGRLEGKLGRIPLEFSATGYFSRNPDVATAVNNDPLLAWSHYWAYGIYEGRAYDDELRVFEYLAINADLTAAFVNDWRQAALHWMRYGRTEGRLGRIPLIFSSTEYLSRNPDVAATWGTDPTTVFLHFWLYGIDEGRTFDDLFRVNEYLARYPDLVSLYGTDRRGAFKHWVRYGQSEGRLGRNP